MLPVTIPLKEPEAINLDSEAVENIRHFRHEFSLLCNLCGLDQMGDELRLSLMHRAVGSPARRIIANLIPLMPEQDQCKVDAILARLENYFSEDTGNILRERLKFNRMVHEIGESLDNFAYRIQHQAARCRFECEVGQKITERFLVGLQHEGQISFILSKGGENVTFSEARHLAKIWWTEQAAMATSISVEMSVCPEPEMPTEYRTLTEPEMPTEPETQTESNTYTYDGGNDADEIQIPKEEELHIFSNTQFESIKTPPVHQHEDEASSADSEEYLPFPMPMKEEYHIPFNYPLIPSPEPGPLPPLIPIVEALPTRRSTRINRVDSKKKRRLFTETD